MESIPGKVSGAWVLRGTRTPVTAFLAGIKWTKRGYPGGNGWQIAALIEAAEFEGFEAIVTMKKNIRYANMILFVRAFAA